MGKHSILLPAIALLLIAMAGGLLTLTTLTTITAEMKLLFVVIIFFFTLVILGFSMKSWLYDSEKFYKRCKRCWKSFSLWCQRWHKYQLALEQKAWDISMVLYLLFCNNDCRNISHENFSYRSVCLMYIISERMPSRRRSFKWLMKIAKILSKQDFQNMPAFHAKLIY